MAAPVCQCPGRSMLWRLWPILGPRWPAQVPPALIANQQREVNMGKSSIAVFLICLLASAGSIARDDRNRYSIEDAMNTASAKEKLNKGYTFAFGSQSHGKVSARHGEYMSNKKTNAFNKSDEEACQWAFLSAMLSFQDRITAEGGNAVVNIRSYYKKGDFSSPTEFECGNGAIMAGVTFKGDVVTLAN